MSKASEDLKAILELMDDWCKEYGHHHVSAFVIDGSGSANADISTPNRIDVEMGYKYEETPAAGTVGESM